MHIFFIYQKYIELGICGNNIFKTPEEPARPVKATLMYKGANNLKWIRGANNSFGTRFVLKNKRLYSVFFNTIFNSMCGFSITEMSKIHIISFYIKKKLIQMNQNFYSTIFKSNTETLIFMSLSTTKNRIIHILASV